MHNGGQVSLVVLNWYIRIKIRVATFDTNHSVADSTQTIAASIHKLPDSVFKSVSTAHHRQRRSVRRKCQVVDQFEVSR